MVGLLIVCALAFVPGLEANAKERSGDEAPVWVRENTNRASARDRRRPTATSAVGALHGPKPAVVPPGRRHPSDGRGEGVHNVFLANASELGLPGTFLWLAGAALAIGGGLMRQVRRELWPWKVFLLAATTMIVVAGSVGPLPYAFPLLVLWTCRSGRLDPSMGPSSRMTG